MKEIPSKFFSWNGNVGVADISVLQHHGYNLVGNKVKIKSARTGRVLTFILFNVDYADTTREDIVGWWFYASGLEDTKDIKVLIIND